VRTATRTLILTALITAAVLRGCGAGGGALAPGASATAAGAPPAIQLPDLASDPAAFEGQRLRMSGQYSSLPVPSCGAALHLSPATWALTESGVLVPAAGLEKVLQALAVEGMTITVEGRWQRWEGSVGCGSAAVASTTWHLQAERIVSPNPLLRATLTPLGATSPLLAFPSTSATPAGAIGLPVTSPGAGTPPATPSGTTAPQPTTTPAATPSAPAATPSPGTRVHTPTPTATDAFSPLPSPTEPPSPISTPTEESGSSADAGLPSAGGTAGLLLVLLNSATGTAAAG
jgi:hypothetical protein